MSKNDGGPAFPSAGGMAEIVSMSQSDNGMSLRDYFAAAALTGSLAFPIPGDEKRPDKCAQYCYQYADAMLVERSKSKGAP